jgi:hypothetical protein
VARSNVSTSLRELQGWGLVRVVHVMGDRRDHFDTIHDVWEMFTIIVEERKRREIDPTTLFFANVRLRSTGIRLTIGKPGSGFASFFHFLSKLPPCMKSFVVCRVGFSASSGS